MARPHVAIHETEAHRLRKALLDPATRDEAVDRILCLIERRFGPVKSEPYRGFRLDKRQTVEILTGFANGEAYASIRHRLGLPQASVPNAIRAQIEMMKDRGHGEVKIDESPRLDPFREYVARAMASGFTPVAGRDGLFDRT